MNCHEAKDHLFAGSDRALDNPQRAALDGHVAHCADCRRTRDDLVAALASWRTASAATPVPDVEREWHAVRRKIRGGVEAGTVSTFARPRRFLPWLAVPIAAAAALVLALNTSTDDAALPPPSITDGRPAQVARADSVEVPGRASTAVYVDDKSGWLVVWASEPKSI